MAEAQTGRPYSYHQLDDIDIDEFYTNSNPLYLLRPTDMAGDVPSEVIISRYYVEKGEPYRPQWAVDEDFTYKCVSCGCHMDEDEGYQDDNGEYYCDECWHDSHCSCDMCDERFGNDYVTGVGNYTLCEGCIERYCVTCDCCGDTIITDKGRWSNVSLDEYTHTDDDHTLCENCAERHVNTCESCGCSFYDKYETGEVINHDWYCDSCAEDWHAEHDESEEESEEEIDESVATCARPLDDGDMDGAMQYQLELV